MSGPAFLDPGRRLWLARVGKARARCVFIQCHITMFSSLASGGWGSYFQKVELPWTLRKRDDRGFGENRSREERLGKQCKWCKLFHSLFCKFLFFGMDVLFYTWFAPCMFLCQPCSAVMSNRPLEWTEHIRKKPRPCQARKKQELINKENKNVEKPILTPQHLGLSTVQLNAYRPNSWRCCLFRCPFEVLTC